MLLRAPLVGAGLVSALDGLKTQVQAEGAAAHIQQYLDPTLAAVDLDDAAFQALKGAFDYHDAVVLVKVYL